jgi:hypothetical protein
LGAVMSSGGHTADAAQLRSRIPGQKFLDAIDWVICDALEDVAQVGFRIEPIEFGRTDEAIERCGALAASVRAREQIIF